MQHTGGSPEQRNSIRILQIGNRAFKETKRTLTADAFFFDKGVFVLCGFAGREIKIIQQVRATVHLGRFDIVDDPEQPDSNGYRPASAFPA